MQILEVLSVRVQSGDEAHATVVVDDAAAERAYRVRVTWDASEEQFVRIDVATWWSNDLIEWPVPAQAVLSDVRRAIECDADLRDALHSQVTDTWEDARIYDRVASEGRV